MTFCSSPCLADRYSCRVGYLAFFGFMLEGRADDELGGRSTGAPGGRSTGNQHLLLVVQGRQDALQGLRGSGTVDL